jgi:hypothetical protein
MVIIQNKRESANYRISARNHKTNLTNRTDFPSTYHLLFQLSQDALLGQSFRAYISYLEAGEPLSHQYPGADHDLEAEELTVFLVAKESVWVKMCGLIFGVHKDGM